MDMEVGKERVAEGSRCAYNVGVGNRKRSGDLLVFF